MKDPVVASARFVDPLQTLRALVLDYLRSAASATSNVLPGLTPSVPSVSLTPSADARPPLRAEPSLPPAAADPRTYLLVQPSVFANLHLDRTKASSSSLPPQRATKSPTRGPHN